MPSRIITTVDIFDEEWSRFMDYVVRQIENATHQRSDASRVANRDDAISLPNLEGREDCPTCGQSVGVKPDAVDWVGLPAGVRFDPSDEELLRHLAAKVGRGQEVAHPRIDDFIPHLDGNEGICQTHPEKLPGVKKDGSSRHFFHKPAKAYTTGTRKRRKIHNEDEESGVETRWHKTGKTRPVSDGGQQLGWKKIMVLYRNSYTGKKKAKSEKTNWILHQYHLGPDEEERDGELVVCKVFYQKQPRQCTGARQAEAASADGDSSKPEASQAHPRVGREISVACVSDASRGTLITPRRDAPNRPQFSRHRSREASPLQAYAEPVATKTPTQSGRGSDMTVMGKPDHINSEMTSSLGVSLKLAQTLAACRNPGSLLSGGQVHSVPLETLCENCSPDWNEEVSTSGKSCQNENALIAIDDQSFKDDEYDAPMCLAGRSQLPETDQDPFELPDLHCTEELNGTPFYPDLGAQSFEHDGAFEGFHAFGDIFNPYPEYPEYDDFLLSTPPAISSDMALSSQDVSEMMNLKPCVYDPNDNSDSLSST